jgi:hypothetical protein
VDLATFFPTVYGIDTWGEGAVAVAGGATKASARKLQKKEAIQGGQGWLQGWCWENNDLHAGSFNKDSKQLDCPCHWYCPWTGKEGKLDNGRVLATGFEDVVRPVEK